MVIATDNRLDLKRNAFAVRDVTSESVRTFFSHVLSAHLERPAIIGNSYLRSYASTHSE